MLYMPGVKAYSLGLVRAFALGSSQFVSESTKNEKHKGTCKSEEQISLSNK
jgi:hypothetical protein